MTFVLSHTSALDCWLNSSWCVRLLWNYRNPIPGKDIRGLDGSTLSRRAPAASSFAASVASARFLAGLGIIEDGAKLQVYVSDKKRSGGNDLFEKHVYPISAPPRSLVPLAKGVFASCPELCFVQMANTLSLIELVQLGYRLCAAFSIDGKTGELRRSDPIVSLGELSSFVAKCAGVWGQKKALQALKYVLPDAGSPKEIALSMLVTMPSRYGGYGLGRPRLNARVELSEDERRASGRSFFLCDMLWADKGVAVEYDSRQYHDGSHAFERDSIKRTVLSGRGYDVLTITTAQLYDPVRFSQCMKALTKKLGKKYRSRSSAQENKESLLREIVL